MSALHDCIVLRGMRGRSINLVHDLSDGGFDQQVFCAVKQAVKVKCIVKTLANS